jgi:hypothetical protein
MFLPITTLLLAPYETHAHKMKYRRFQMGWHVLIKSVDAKTTSFDILKTCIDHNRFEMCELNNFRPVTDPFLHRFCFVTCE